MSHPLSDEPQKNSLFFRCKARTCWENNFVLSAGREILSVLVLCFSFPLLVLIVRFTHWQLCVLSKREYPGFSWIYFKVNPIITFSFIAKLSLMWILLLLLQWVYLLLALPRSRCPLTPRTFVGKPAPGLPHQPNRHRIGHWVPNGRSLSLQLHSEEIQDSVPQLVWAQKGKQIVLQRSTFIILLFFSQHESIILILTLCGK